MSLIARLRSKLEGEVDGASLFTFRITFGLVMLYQFYSYWDRGWIRDMFIELQVRFPHLYFEWVKPWPGNGMYWHFGVLALAALAVMLGAWYRFFIVVLCVGFAQVMLSDKSRFLNHYYLVSLFTLLLCFMPAARGWSLDALRRPRQRGDTVPFWCLALLRFQVGIVFFFGGVTKLNPDWLQGEPVRHWLEARSNAPVIGPLLTTDVATFVMAYGGLTFDLLAFPLLLWKRTRLAFFCVSLFFHFSNSLMFNIGIFPVLAIAAELLFFSPSWPRRFLKRWVPEEPQSPRPGRALKPWGMALIVAYVTWQLLFPLRRFAYEGPSSWTLEAMEFSWMMMNRHTAGSAQFQIQDPRTGLVFGFNTARYLNWNQDGMLHRPDGLIQMAHFIADQFAKSGTPGVKVMAITNISLNGRPMQALVDPTVDLAKEQRGLHQYRWVLPLANPLPDDRKLFP